MKSRILLFIAFLAWASLLVTCGGSDDRDYYRKNFGEPDSSWVTGADVFWRESWYYRSSGYIYEFRRTQGCGSDRSYYLYQRYFVGYLPLPGDSLGADSTLNKPEFPSEDSDSRTRIF
ncbi:hypothetical protein KC799_15180 [candidate division KSB1 bacterium]|nr:hypothetical protein [candidate division KSB1 bacterium]